MVTLRKEAAETKHKITSSTSSTSIKTSRAKHEIFAPDALSGCIAGCCHMVNTPDI